uniref:hypothetical protein n=1 Tax=Campylobacter mucosalis TaxID=202 RepID=UPI0014703024
MKFSKIACVALLSASISTVALATKLDDVQNAKADEATRTAGYKEIMKVINELKTIGYENLAKWNGAQAVNGGDQLKAEVNSKIYAAFGRIETLKDKIAPGSDKLEIKGSTGSKLVIGSDKSIKITIADDGNTAVQETTLTLTDFEGINKEKIKQIFAENNRDVWKAFIEDFTKQHNIEQEKRKGNINIAALELAKDLISDRPESVPSVENEYTAYIENRDVMLNGVRADIATREKAVIDAQGKVNEEIKKVDNKKLTLLSKDNAGITKQSKIINEELTKQLTAAKNKGATLDDIAEKVTALKVAIRTGVKLQTKTVGGRELTEKDIDTIAAGGANLSINDFDNGGAQDFTGGDNIKKVLDALIGDAANNAETGAFKATKEAQAEITKVTNKINDVNTANGELEKSNKLMTKIGKVIAKATSDEG